MNGYAPSAVLARAAGLIALLAGLAACEQKPPGVPHAGGAGPLDSAPDIVARQVEPAALLQGEEDAELAGKVSVAIATEPGLRVQAIEVKARQGVVTLEGLVATPEDSHQAARVAAGVEGVRSVRNELLIPGS